MASLLLLTSTLFAQKKPQYQLGGALRFNYNYSDWKAGNTKRGGDFGFDVFRLNAKASYKEFFLDAEYRFYPSTSGGGMLKHGWLGYRINEYQHVQLGLTVVPFGIQPYTSNSYFFNINYYLGLEDDSDMGIKYSYRKNAWEFAAAFFKNSDELQFGSDSESSPDRYAYDVGGRNKEVNQGNLQLIYHFGQSVKQQVGASVLLGGLYNLDTEKMGTHYAMAVHYVVDYSNWNLKLQYANRKLSPRNKVGEDRSEVVMSAYGSSYYIASHFNLYSAALAYTFQLNKGVWRSVQVYNDFSLMEKLQHGYANSIQNVTGCLIDLKPVYVYVDCALGKNHAWLGGDWERSFSHNTSDAWGVRLNVNMGYYF
ncbi:hypothetical protein [Bacteroides sp.]|uniref:hypothetical protein n=1 Tax=Bacteroides sp. TaxID=29523 RepID=UPI0025C3FC8B|nr:hypothetical protein [Bacteroides sp.]